MERLYDLTLSTEVASEHPVWAKPFAGGPLKAFFIPSVRLGREIVELIRRTDIRHENVTIDRYWDINKWGFGDFYHKRGGKGDFEVLYRNLENALTSEEEYDVLVLPGLNGWGYFTEKTRRAIVQRVERGTGLVLIHPFSGEGFAPVEALEWLSPLQPLHEEGFNARGYPRFEPDRLRGGRWIPNPHYITSGVPFDIFPYEDMGYYPYEASGDVILEGEDGMPIAAVKTYGAGRVAAFGYYPRDVLPQHRDFTWFDKCYEPIVANWHGVYHRLPFNYLEYFYGLIYRSMVWAARKEPQLQLEESEISEKGDQLQVRVSGAAGGSVPETVEYRIKNFYDEPVATGTSATGEIRLPDGLRLGGDYRVEMLLRTEGAVADFAARPIRFPLTAQIRSITLSSGVVPPGERIQATISAQGAQAELDIEVIDDFERVLHRETRMVNGDADFLFGYTVPDMRSLHGRVRASVRREGFLLHRLESERFVATPRPENRKLDDFEVLLCPQNRGQGDLFALEAKRLHEMGVTGSFIGDSKMSTLSGAEGCGIGWYDRGPYVEMKEKYYRTKDKSVLQRSPCLNDPAFQRSNEEHIAQTLKNNAKYGPLAYFAQDEGSLTCYSDELDLCFCPHCMAAMRSWLGGEYAGLDPLNETWGTAFQAWEDVVPFTFEEAKRTGHYASWGDHRRFMEITYANAYKLIRDAIRRTDPHGEVRMSGCQASTPYTGCDYELLHQSIGYFEAYGIGNQYEFHRSFANPGTMIGGWFGYGSSGLTVYNRLWHALYHGLTLISIFWEYSCLNPDFTFSQSAVDMGNVFKEIKREGIGKLLLHSTKRDHLGIALHYSMPSVHGSYLREDQKRFEDNRQGWIDLLEDLGYQYNFVASRHIEAGRLIADGYKLLILPYSIAVSAAEAAEIEKFASAGGMVIGDFQTGLMDVHCRLSEHGCLDGLFGIERLLTDTQPFFVNTELVQNKDFPYFELFLYDSQELMLAERGTRAQSGTAGYSDDFTRNVAAVVVHEYGLGKGVYLNFALAGYPALRKTPGGGERTRALFRHILGLSAVEKFIGLTGADGRPLEQGFETVYYSDREAEYAAVLRGLDSGAKIGYDGLAVDDGNGGSDAAAPERVCVRLRKKAHVYDVRQQTYLGFTDMADLVLPPGETGILSMLPCKVDSVRLDLPDRSAAGAALRLAVEIESAKPDNAYANVLSIRFTDPDGEYSWMYSENAAVAGRSYARSIDLPFNEKAGMWTVRVKDTATGVSTERRFEVVPCEAAHAVPLQERIR